MAHRLATTNIMHVDYAGPSGSHTFQIRFADSTTAQQAATETDAFMQALAAQFLTAVTLQAYRWQAKGSYISTSVPFATFTASGGAAGAPSTYPSFISFVGRGVNGLRVRISLFDTKYQPDNNYRLQGTELTAPLTAILVRLNQGGNSFAYLSAAGDITRWKNYINLGQNAYYQRKRRRVGA